MQRRDGKSHNEKRETETYIQSMVLMSSVLCAIELRRNADCTTPYYSYKREEEQIKNRNRVVREADPNRSLHGGPVWFTTPQSSASANPRIRVLAMQIFLSDREPSYLHVVQP